MLTRLKTGVVQPNGDWPGVFDRGDEAISYADSHSTGRARKRSKDVPFEEIQSWAARTKDPADLRNVPGESLHLVSWQEPPCPVSGNGWTRWERGVVPEYRWLHFSSCGP